MIHPAYVQYAPRCAWCATPSAADNNEVIVQVPISVAAAVCDVNVAVLGAIQDTGDTFCEATSSAVADAEQQRGGRPQ